MQNQNLERSRKRKRENEKLEIISSAVDGFTNAAFSDAPKLIGRRRGLNPNKENIFVPNPCLEVKLISDIVIDAKEKQLISNGEKYPDPPKNPFEVVRKPPKKMKREVEACFENAALNLELPEKQFNPFEVQRAPAPKAAAPQSKCFVNAALNLRGQEEPSSLNPFEIHRTSAVSAVASNPAGVINIGMVEEVPPFLMHYSYDYHNCSLVKVSPTRSLRSTSEESTTDIGKQLDLYQLELENSINEAKLQKNAGKVIEHKSQNLVNSLGQQNTFPQKLTEIGEADEEQDEQQSAMQVVAVSKELHCELKSPKIEPYTAQNINATDGEHKNIAGLVEQGDKRANVISYASDTDDEKNVSDDGFKAPTPFVRAYRRASTKLTVSMQSSHSIKPDAGGEGLSQERKSLNMKTIIRQSIRKLMHHSSDNAPIQVHLLEKAPEKEKSHNILSSIRYSLRRKTSTQLLLASNTDGVGSDAIDISIIDSSERTMKLKSDDNIEQLTTEKKHSLRHSIRRSTRGIMKTVFHKSQEEYTLE